MAKDLVGHLTEGQRVVAYFFNPDLMERCPFFPPEIPGGGPQGLRQCELVEMGCHFSHQAKYEHCLIYQAYMKGRK